MLDEKDLFWSECLISFDVVSLFPDIAIRGQLWNGTSIITKEVLIGLLGFRTKNVSIKW